LACATLRPMTLDVDDLLRRAERVGEARNATKAQVFVVQDGGRELIVKTLAGRAGGLRGALAAWMLRREGRVLAALSGAPGVPQLVQASGDTLVMERRPGRTLFDLRKKGVSAETAARVESVLAGVHARGFAHGDVGRRDVLVADDGTVSLIDFATAVGPGFPPIVGRLLLPFLRRSDARRVDKLMRRYRKRWEKNAARRAGARSPRTPEGPAA
jgi:RIO-like serine/threonine protein kinase